MSILNAAELEMMRTELGALLRRAMTTGDWLPYQEALDGWIGTDAVKGEIDLSTYRTPVYYASKGAAIKGP